MTNKSLALIVGQAVGFKCLKKIAENKKIKIKYVVSSDEKYDEAIKSLCKYKNIKFFSREYFYSNKNKFFLSNYKSDYLLSIFSKIILKDNFLESFKYKCYNFHPGILPYYPGLNSISGMIYNAEKRIGVTLHKITTNIDSGNIILIKQSKISKHDNLFNCMKKIEKLTIKILISFLDIITKQKKIKEFKNDTKKIKKFPKIIPHGGKINFNWKFIEFLRHFNAGFSGPYKSQWGKIFFFFNGKKKFVNNYETYNKKKLIKLIEKEKNYYLIRLKDKVLKIRS